MIKNEIDKEVGRNDFSDCVKTYYQDLKQYPPIPREKERKLLQLAKDGDIDARNQIISANLRFVFDIAKKYRNHGVDISDLISSFSFFIFISEIIFGITFQGNREV